MKCKNCGSESWTIIYKGRLSGCCECLGCGKVQRGQDIWSKELYKKRIAEELKNETQE